MLPLLYGFIGFIVLVVLFSVLKQGGKMKCPACRQMIPKDSKLCPNCQTSLVADPLKKFKAGP